MLVRQLGEAFPEIEISEIPLEGEQEVYEIEAAEGRLKVRGSSAVAICRGVYSYLRESCGSMITWSGQHLDLPAQWPTAAAQRVVCPYRFVQYLNPCTYGYTMAFWDWARWERELDWMALHGINMPLAMEGQEAIWQQVWLSFGLSESEVDQFSTGPGHLPWHRMGNINNFDGPLSQNWIEQKRLLQKKILDRMRELDMKPVAPAFAGFVPQGFKRVHPEAETFTLLWLPEEFKTIPRSTRTFILHPGQTELYREIGKRFIERYKAEYGEVSYYLADTFNELSVPVREEHREKDLERFGRTVYEGILAGDPEGTWVMQGWAFVYDAKFWDNAAVAALLRGVPDDRMLILDYSNDLAADVKGKYSPEQWKLQKAFFGKQWLHGMAHTFGGNNNIKGNLSLMASAGAAALASAQRGNLAGWSMCPEGIENNEVVYELMTDAAWQREAIDLDIWIPAYCRSRYGACPESMRKAWELLQKTAYGSHIWMTKQAWQTEPGSHPEAVAVNAGPEYQQAVELFLACAPQLGGSELYRNDVIELTVQAVGGYVDKVLAAAVALYPDRRDDAVRHAAQAVVWMEAMDGLLNIRTDRRLETWTTAARSWARNNAEAAFYDENARRLITTWGWPELSDYAARAWSGLARDYYAARWKAWFEARHRGAAFSLDLWQQTWLSSPYRPSPATPVGDAVVESRRLLEACRRYEI
ncbi:alpha-N-acetylglucosaminidase [Silvibacterium dinghuense]|uniref:alpha-N-acetylglucosaminidase n=1 Tax=Silvibacterium dinghuense TaxID=1560006 RepID=UPI0019AE3DBE|nr:alpha-N-acetylglucosaminidase [Silvibacterium dinghuense]GGH17116.1 alpha-N-acetylglucosaminidase [Silvibacterium dinghuense]